MTPPRSLREFPKDAAGQATVEYALLLAAIVLPMVYIYRMLLGALANMFGLVTLMLSLPFP